MKQPKVYDFQIPLFTMGYSRLLSYSGLASMILNRLKKEGLYQPTLVYHVGAIEKESDIVTIRAVGTDRFQRKERREAQKVDDIVDDLLLESDDLAVVLRERREEQEREDAEAEAFDLPDIEDPNFIWGLPEQGLREGITTYLPGGDSGIILAYRADSLIFYGADHLPNTEHRGKPVEDVPLNIRLNVDHAQYQFRTTARDAAVALLWLKQKARR